MTKEINMFEKASRMAVRFDSNKGLLTTEDLWKLPLSALDAVAKTVNRDVKASEEESFVKPKAANNELAEFKLEVVKHIISVRLDEHEESQRAKANAERKQHLVNLLAQKDAEKDAAMDRDQILAELSKLS